jgi:hypothetical protein
VTETLTAGNVRDILLDSIEMTTLTVKIKSTGPSAIQQDNKKIK